MIPEELAKWTIGILTANFLGMLFLGWRITRFLSRLEFKVDLMWSKYVKDVRASEHLLEGIPIGD